MSQRTRVIALLLSVSVPSVLLAGCNKQQQKTQTAKRAEQASGEVVEKEQMVATVEAVDTQRRTVTLREPEGDLVTVEVGQGVSLDRIQPQDKVNVAYQEALAFELQEPGSSPVESREESTERLPEGVQFGRRVTTTVEILAVAPKGTAATFRNQEGDVRTVEVDNPINQEKVAHLRPGDNVEVTYTEKLAVQLEQ